MKKIIFSLMMILCLITLVSCSNKKTTTSVKRETVEILESDLETQICDVAEFLDGATFCVLNYSSTESEDASSLGSGVIYKRVINSNNTYTYYLVTNRHVIIDGEKFKVYTSSGSTMTANKLGYSEVYDIGVLTFTSYEKFNVVPFGDIEDVRQGEMCFAMGTPLYMSYVNTFTSGNVSAIRSERIQHTADINAGNSGGPLVNLSGQLIGINVSKISTSGMGQADVDGMCFAIRVDKVKEAIDEIEGCSEAVTNPLLGISVTDVSNVLNYDYDTFEDMWNSLYEEFAAPYRARHYKEEAIKQLFDDAYASSKSTIEENYINLHVYNLFIPDGVTTGMIVRSVTEGSVCDTAGVEMGDIVVKINNVTVKNQTNFSTEFYKYGIGDTINITINRAGTLSELSITL